jgi:hypothetical protein
MARGAIVGGFPNARGIRQKLRGISVAVEASCHRELSNLTHDLHILDISVAIGTLNPFVHMSAVVEVRKVRNPVNPLPRQGHSFLVVFGELDDLRTVLPGDGVAIHAD